MENYTRENVEFWNDFVSEITSEINEKKLLEPYINKIKNSNKKEEGHTNAQSFIDYLINDVFINCDTFIKYGFTIINSIGEREHGDFYLVVKDEYIKIKICCNGKIGVAEKLGRPNVCSIERAHDYLVEKNLPYFIFKLRKLENNFDFKIFDLYNYLNYMTYNDGPGQIMMKESNFYEEKEFKYLKTSDAIIYLCDMQEEGYNKLFIKRNIRRIKFKKSKEKYVTK
jgi:hypothetical protein